MQDNIRRRKYSATSNLGRFRKSYLTVSDSISPLLNDHKFNPKTSIVCLCTIMLVWFEVEA